MLRRQGVLCPSDVTRAGRWPKGGQKDLIFPGEASNPGKCIVDCQFAAVPGIFVKEGPPLFRLTRTLEQVGDLSEFLEV